jgi:DNA-binding NtrC family response regulator
MSLPSRILVVEDEQAERDGLADLLRCRDFDAVTAATVEEALACCEQDIDVVVSALKIGPRSGLELLESWKDHSPTTPFIVVTVYDDAESAVQAMKLGAEDYLTKPVDPDQLVGVIRTCLAERAHKLPQRAGFENLIAQSEVMLRVFDQTWRAAQTDSTVLIVGESGTGKELIAEAVHRNSPRSSGPFVTVNMAAIPENLVESELFGHVRGAYTGATVDREGRFQSAHGGTLFIDEVGDFHLGSQAKLLRALENGVVSPVGSNKEETVDVRVVAATSRDLFQMLQTGQFREDLFYRLNVVALQLPPLRDRREDIRLLVQAFLMEFCEQLGRPLLKIEPDLMRYLESYDWPGNVRQLRNCLESMVVMAEHDVLPLDDLPPHLENRSCEAEEVYVPKDMTLEELEREAIRQALVRYQGNRTHAADSLGISVRTLQRRIRDWDLEEELL